MDVITNRFNYEQAVGNINWNSHTFKWILCSGTYNSTTFADMDTYSQVSAFELPTANGYVQGGIIVSTSAYRNDVDDTVVYWSDNPSWITSGGDLTFRYAVQYDASYDNCLVYFYDFEKDQVAYDGAVITINMSTDGQMVASKACKNF